MTSVLDIENAKACTRVFYAGFADAEKAKMDGKDVRWKIFPATPQGYAQARAEGYTATSAFEFSHPVPTERGKPQPIRHGDIVLDVDATQEVTDEDGNVVGKTGDIEKARLAVVLLVERLSCEYGLNPHDLRFFASGGKGFHVYIPVELFGGEEGDINLHEIYKGMINDIIHPLYVHKYRTELMASSRLAGLGFDVLLEVKYFFLKEDNMCIDDNLFKGGRGQLVRLPHIQRADGRYKVPVSYDEIVHNSITFFEEIVLSDRTLGEGAESSFLMLLPRLEELFLRHKVSQGTKQIVKAKPSSVESIRKQCTFIQFCQDYPHDVDEPRWFLLARILYFAGNMGKILFHALSKLDWQRYSPREAEYKLANASKYGVATCDEIRGKGYCKENCGVKCPLDLFQKQHAATYDAGTFEVRADGLYYYPDAEDLSCCCLIASYVNVLARARDAESKSWAKYVEVKDPDSILHYCTISNADLTCSGEQALAILSNLGLCYNTESKIKSKLLLYLRSTNPEKRVLLVDKNGWVEGKLIFFPLDAGTQEDGNIIQARTPASKQSFEQLGTLQEWQENIAKLCEGNFLLQIAMLAALAGPFLKFFSPQGFGLHFYGSSSSGKTTCLMVAGSVTGGELKSWRTTDNALEAIASEHNDNCLLLDEIGQCTPEVVDNTAYMLSHGKGKERLNKEANLKLKFTWLMTYLSSGELLISEKIKQGYKKDPMAGQEVRCINLLADGGQKLGLFTKVPEQMNPADFANALGKNSAVFKGTALMEVVRLIKEHHAELTKNICSYMNEFMQQFDVELSSQARRVAKHFAFLAGVGEFCILHKLLPWKPKAAIHVAQLCFEHWVKDNGSNVQYEIKNLADKILLFVKQGFYATVHARDHALTGENNAGKPVYKCLHGGKNCMFISNQYLIKEKFCRPEQLEELKKYLLSMHLLIHDKNGNIREQDYHGSSKPRTRGMFIVIDNLYADDFKQTDAIAKNIQKSSDAYEVTYTYSKDMDLNF